SPAANSAPPNHRRRPDAVSVSWVAVEGGFYGGDRRRWVVDSDHQTAVAVVLEFDDDGVGWVAHVPEDPLAVVMERANNDDPAHEGPGRVHSFALVRDARIGGGAAHMVQRYG